jgi:hypothetical protein
MRRRYDKYQPSKSGVNGGNRACLCKHKDTYSRECCDGGLWAQGIGSIQGVESTEAFLLNEDGGYVQQEDSSRIII